MNYDCQQQQLIIRSNDFWHRSMIEKINYKLKKEKHIDVNVKQKQQQQKSGHP